MKLPKFLRLGETLTESRNAPYTDAITTAIIAAAGRSASEPDAHATAAVEIGVGVLSRAFAVAEVSGATIDPSDLSDMVRKLLIAGETVRYYDGFDLVPASGWEIAGSYRRSTWQYVMEFPTPSGATVTVRAGADRVLHPRYSFDVNQPWLGIGPIQRAVISGKLQANLEQSLRNEMSGTVGYLLPIPTSGDDPSVADLKNDIASLKGKTAVVETTAGGWGEGRLAAPSQDYQPKRIGPSPPETMCNLHRAVQYSILAVLGVPVELVTASDGTGQREGWRRCLHGTIQPLARVIEVELSRVYARRVTLNFDALMASDVQGRARAFQSMVAGGMSVTEAAAQSGLLADD